MAKEIMVSEDWLAAKCQRICAKAAAVPLDQRRQVMQDELASLQVSSVLKDALEIMILVGEETVIETQSSLEKKLGWSFGVFFVIVLLILAIEFPKPTPFQLFVFRVVLALAASGVGGILSGFLTVAFGNAKKPWLQAGGGLAIFAIVYLVNPAQLVIGR
jgi:hypothetical protein